MRKIALVVVATLAICGTAAAASLVYFTGVYSGSTSQGHGIAMRVVRPHTMKKMIYYVNFRCYTKHGPTLTLSNHKTVLGSANIDSNQQINTTYHNSTNTDSVHLQVTLNHTKATGDFKEALVVFHNGHKYLCVTPGGQATAAGKVFFAMHHT